MWHGQWLFQWLGDIRWGYISGVAITRTCLTICGASNSFTKILMYCLYIFIFAYHFYEIAIDLYKTYMIDCEVVSCARRESKEREMVEYIKHYNHDAYKDTCFYTNFLLKYDNNGEKYEPKNN